MRVGPRTTLAMVVVAGLPLAIAGWTAISLSGEALVERAERANAIAARALATRIADATNERLRAIELAAAAIDVSALAPDERVWALRLVYRQIQDASAVALFGPDGSQAAEPVFLSQKSEDESLQERPVVSDADLSRFAKSIPFGLAKDVGRVIGPAYASEAGAPRIAVAVSARGGFVLAVELSMSRMNELLAEHGVGDRAQVFAVDDHGHVILAQDPEVLARRDDRSKWPIVSSALANGEDVRTFDSGNKGTLLGAAKRVPGLGWAVVVSEPREDALAGARTVALRMMVWFGAALVLALGLGIAMSRTIVRPVKALHRATRAIEEGDFDYRVEQAARSDELGDLARAFNLMAEEVEGWRTDLERKVAVRTRELKESQELLVRAQKMAAVGQLGASVSHEINNPLCAVIGMTDLMLADAEPGSTNHQDLEVIRSESVRIKGIVSKLLQLADEQEGQARELDVRPVVEDALTKMAGELQEHGMQVEREYADDLLPVIGDPETLSEAFCHLVDNARKAMTSDSGILKVTVRSDDAQLVKIAFEDDGAGISEEHQHRIFDPFYTTRLDQDTKGLGLTRVNQIVEQHHGSVLVDSRPEHGSVFTIMLPAVQKRSIA